MGTNAVHLGTSQPQDRESKLYMESDWLDAFRAAEMEEEQVLPGGIGTFKFKVRSDVRGRFSENFQLVMERVGWIEGASVRWQINVTGTAKTSSSSSATTKTTTTTTTSSSNTTTASVVTPPNYHCFRKRFRSSLPRSSVPRCQHGHPDRRQGFPDFE